MFKISSNTFQIRNLLLRSRPSTVPVAQYTRSTPCLQMRKVGDPARDFCPEPPKPCPPNKDDRLMWGTIAAILVTGGFAYYAKTNPELRDWITIHAPWFDDFIAIVNQENYTYIEYGMRLAGDIKKAIADYSDTRECTVDEEGNAVYTARPIADKKYDPCEDEAEQKHTEEAAEAESEGGGEEKDEEDEDEGPPCLEPPVPEVKTICEMEACLKDIGDNTINNYMTARDACIVYNKMVNDAMLNFTIKDMKNLREEMRMRKELVKKSLRDGDYTFEQLKVIQHYVECGGMKQFNKQQTDDILKIIKEYLTTATVYKTEFTWENTASEAYDIQWRMVECTIDRYATEIRSYYAKLNFEDEKPQLNTADLDYLLIHTQKYVDLLTKQLNEAASIMTERVDRALSALPQENKSKRESAINSQYSEKKSCLEKEFNQRIASIKENAEKTMKELLKEKQAEFEKKLAAAIDDKAIGGEIQKKFDKMVAAEVKKEQAIMDAQLAEMRAKLNIVEEKLNVRLRAERETRRSQELYAAAVSLLAATKKGGPAVKVDNELRAIEKASGDGDKLVLSVLHGIPNQVWDRGVVPESALKERYKSMEKVALKVALVESDGAPLPIYLLSWLQALLLCMKMTTIPQAEVDNPPKEIQKDLDTFDLLQRARFWLERGNLSLALRYVEALKGASRVAADGWHDDAKVHIEIRQAAEAIIAHAASLALTYV